MTVIFVTDHHRLFLLSPGTQDVLGESGFLSLQGQGLLYHTSGGLVASAMTAPPMASTAPWM